MDDRGPIYTDKILTLDDADLYSIHFYGYDFSVVVTSQESAVRRWMSQFNSVILQARRALATLSLLWPDNAEVGHRPATIQLCVIRECLVFQIARAGHTIPSPILEFFQDDRFIFYGWSNLSDQRRLWQSYGVRVRNQVRALPGQPVHMNDRRLMIEQEISQQLGYNVSLSEDVYRSRWDVPELSIEQVEHAALEACLAYLVATGSRSSRESSPSMGSRSSRESSPSL